MKKKITIVAMILALSASSNLAMAQDTNVEIASDVKLLTMVNVLTPKKGQQKATIKQLQKALDTVLVSQPGFISGSVHRSLDSGHIVNYAQWKNQAALMAFVGKLKSGKAPAMAKVFAMATPNFHPYAVVSVHHGKK